MDSMITNVQVSTADDDSVSAQRDAAEQTRTLLKRMAARRKVMLGILDYCREPKTVREVETRVQELQAQNVSVYSAAALCAMLEETGALTREADGKTLESKEEYQPETEIIDGVEYLKPHRMAPVLWHTTLAGEEVLNEDDPLDRFRALIESDSAYAPIYLKVLDLCTRNNGATAKELGDAVDHDPLVQNPRYFAQHFVERLERCDILEWNTTWRATQLGKDAREELALAASDR